MLKTDALLYFGSKTKLAQAAGIRLASLYSWKGDLVPEGRAMRLQEASGGELRKIFCEDGLYAVCVENGNLVSHYRIMCLRKNGAALINFVDARVTDGFILREGEFVTSLQALKEIGIKAGFSAFSGE